MSAHDELLDELWAKFGHIARERVDLLAQAVAKLRAVAPDAREACAAAQAECHKLVGSLDSYGRSGGSALAARAELLLGTLLDAGLDAAVLDELGDVTAGLLGLFEPGATATATPHTCVCARCGDVHVPLGEPA